jgi:hypothetical protein
MNQKNYKGALLLIVGIAIGIALTAICMNAVSHSNTGNKLLATNAHEAPSQPPGAASAETPQTAPPGISHVTPTATPHVVSHGQVDHHQAPAAESSAHGWLTPEDVAREEAAKNGVAPATVKKPAEPTYKSSHTTYYVYHTGGVHDQSGVLPTAMGGYPVTTEDPMVGDNGLIQNPCVDPPSVRRGRAYRQPLQQ